MNRFLNKQINFVVGLALVASSAAFAGDKSRKTSDVSDDAMRHHDGAVTTREDESTAGRGTASSTTGTTSSAGMVPSASITFSNGSATLTETQKNELRDFAAQLGSGDEIEDITVASWSDKELPRQGQKLSKADRDLADKRNKAVKDFLKDSLKVKSDVDTYSMAEDANWLARTFRTDEAELKSVFSKRGSKTPVDQEEFMTIRNEGGPSRAIIVGERKDHD